MQCPHCGAPLNDAEDRCPSCGQRPPVPDGTPTPPRWPLWLVGALAICLVAAGLITAGILVSWRAKSDSPPTVAVRPEPGGEGQTQSAPAADDPAQDTPAPAPFGQSGTEKPLPRPEINETAKQMLPGPNEEVKGLVKELDIFGAIRDRDAVRVMQILSKHPELANHRNYKGATPLHLAAALEDERMVRQLIECKADVNAKCDQEMLRGQTALHIAAGRNCTKVMRILLDHGAQVNARDFMDATPLHEAAAYGSLEAAALLLKSGAAVDAKQSDGQTALFWAATVSGSVKVARLLLDHGADVNARDYSEMTPLTWAKNMENRKEIVALLKKYGGKE